MTSSAVPAGGRVAVVTGASKGIGRTTAEWLSRSGYRVVLCARDEAALKQVASSLDGEALVVPCDVTVPSDVLSAFETAETIWGSVDVLVVNAGAGASSPLAETSDEDWQRMLDLNLTAPFRCIRRAVPGMVSRGWGRIVVVASVAAKRGESRIAAYSASKHGVLGLVRSAASELARTGVTVNAVCPGYVDTPMTDDSVAQIAARTGRSLDEARSVLERQQPIRRLVTTDEVAQAVLLCVENGAINGQGLNVDGGAVQS
ncbi:MAG TPA: SDR family oxidoreductase [Nocardioidaceae bacterium]|nr:SDR family oxidoreductase [Nocardioidaceae bacterium]